jgi:DNA modification methylase
MTISLIPGDCIEKVQQLATNGTLVDAMVTDPPYLKDLWTPPGMVAISHSSPKPGRPWQPILKQGGYLLAFGSPRTHHRLWSAIEAGGLIIQDTVMWVYGQGFPKNKMQLKPAWEPIALAYKPGGKRNMQIDECRTPGHNTSIERRETARRTGKAPGHPGEYGPKMVNRITPKTYMADHPGEQFGRWPANLVHDGSPEVIEAFDQFGTRDGNPAKFFFCAKATKADRAGSTHPSVKPIKLLQWLICLVTPPGGTVLDPFAGSGTTGAAAELAGRHAILVENDPQYIADIQRRISRRRKSRPEPKRSPFERKGGPQFRGEPDFETWGKINALLKSLAGVGLMPPGSLPVWSTPNLLTRRPQPDATTARPEANTSTVIRPPRHGRRSVTCGGGT